MSEELCKNMIILYFFIFFLNEMGTSGVGWGISMCLSVIKVPKRCVLVEKNINI